MNIDLGNDFLNEGELVSVDITKKVGEHSKLEAIIAYAEADLPDNLSDVLGARLECRFEDGDVQEELFSGMIWEASITALEVEGTRRTLVEAYSDSVKADSVPQFRVFQKPGNTLRSIVDDVLGRAKARGEVGQADLSSQVVLSVQYGETDFAYLKRLVGAYGIPIIVDDVRGVVVVGQVSGSNHEVGAAEILAEHLVGRLGPMLSGDNFSVAPGRLGEFQRAITDFDRELGTKQLYFPSSGHQDSQRLLESTWEISDRRNFTTAFARRLLKTRKSFFAIGDHVAANGGASETVLGVRHRYLADPAFGSERFYGEYLLCPSRELVGADAVDLPWRSRMFLAEVKKNEGDPDNLGRVKIQFDWEDEGGDGCWVDVSTPYSGHAGESSGFLMLPEEGEKVLVKFLEPWDDKPIVVGSLRRDPIVDSRNTAKEKFLGIPSGSYLLILHDGGNNEIALNVGDGEGAQILLKKTSQSSLTITCSDSIKLKAREIELEGDRVTVKATQTMDLEAQGQLSAKGSAATAISSDGNVSVRGALVQIN